MSRAWSHRQKSMLLGLRHKAFVALICSTLAASLGALVAHAADTTKKTEKVNLSDIKEVKRAKKTPEKGQARNSRGEAFIAATETKLLSEITKAINYLQKQVVRMPKKSPTRLEVRDRLVNLRLEAALYHASQAMRKYDQEWEAWDQGGRRGPEPKLDESKSRGQWAELAKDAQSLLEEYPRSKNADVTTFNMALAYYQLKKEKEAARLYSQIISKYPNSAKAGDSYYALGEFYFERNDFRNAQNNFKNALKFRQAALYAWALHKLGWCSYNLNQYQQSLAYWKQTVSETSRTGKKGILLKEEALRDMVYAFAELRQIEPAIAYYKRNGGEKYIGKFLLLLAETFTDQGQYNDSINVLKRYQQVEPLDAEVPTTQKEIIGLNYELGRMPTVWAELARYPKLFGPGSRWAEANQKDKALYEEVQQTIKDQILYYAKLTHKNGQKDNSARLNAEALKGYSLFLQNYPKAREVAEVKYNMADIYYFTKNFRESGKLYRDIVLMGKDKAQIYPPKTNKGETIHKKSADFMLDSYASQFDPELKVLLKIKPDFSKAPRPLSDDAKNFLAACGTFQQQYKDDKKNNKLCDIGITEIYYRSADKKMAMKYLWMLAKKYPGTKEGDAAVEQLVPLYENDKPGLEKTIGELRKIPAYQSGKIGTKLKDLEYGVAVDVAKSDKNACSRAKKYEELYKKNPASKDAVGLINNAAVDYIKCGKIPDGIAAYLIVLRKFPTVPTAKDALLEVAKLQENRLDLAAAASFYAEFAKKYGKDKEAIGALAKACELEAALSAPAAVNTCLAFGGADANNAKIIFQRMMRTAYSAGDAARVVTLARTFEAKFKVSPEERIITYAMVYNLAKGQGAVAQQSAQVIMDSFRKAGGNVQGEAIRAVGALVFRQANGAMAKFQAVKLKGGTVDALAASIQQKVQALGALQQSYDQVLAVKDAFWGVAAFHQMAYAREMLAKDLENPPEIKGAPMADVVKQLAGDAKAARAEAAKFYKLALESVEKYLVYNEWAAKSLSGFARNAGRNVVFEDLIVRPDFLGAEVPENIAVVVKAGGEG